MGEGRGVTARLRGLVRELARFGTVGAFGVLVNAAVFYTCVNGLDLLTVPSGVLATGVAIGTNYVGNRYWTYRQADKSRARRELSLFLLFSGVGLVIENGVLALSHNGLGLTSPLADGIAKYVVGLGLGTAFRFWSYRTWVFRRVAAAEPAMAEAVVGGAFVRAAPDGDVAVPAQYRSDRLVGVAAQEEGEDRRVQL